jgi:hypothetical protein
MLSNLSSGCHSGHLHGINPRILHFLYVKDFNARHRKLFLLADGKVGLSADIVAGT